MYNLAVSFWLKKIHIVLEFHTACNLINDTVDNNVEETASLGVGGLYNVQLWNTRRTFLDDHRFNISLLRIFQVVYITVSNFSQFIWTNCYSKQLPAKCRIQTFLESN